VNPAEALAYHEFMIWDKLGLKTVQLGSLPVRDSISLERVLI
jgi:hypothetical protein